MNDNPFEPKDLALLELLKRPKKEYGRPTIKWSYFQLLGFVAARNGNGWVPARSRAAMKRGKLSATQKATRLYGGNTHDV